MSNAVNQLLDVDRQARLILDEAQHYHDETMKEIEQEKSRMQRDFQTRAKSHLDQVEQTESAAAREAAGNVQVKYTRLGVQLEAHFTAHHREWEDELFKICLGR